MVTKKQLDDLIKFQTASWAIWNNKNLNGNTNQFYYDNISVLKSETILLGINPSKEMTSAFNNFHKSNHRGDNYLKAIFSNERIERLKGSYMTDLSLQIEPNSLNVEFNLAIDKTRLEEQINILENKVSKIICFGNKTFIALSKMYCQSKAEKMEQDIKHFKFSYLEKHIDVYGCFHYSNRGFNNDEVKKLPVQLKFINDFCF